MNAPETIGAIRRFNRFYTSAIGVLDRAYLGSPYSLAENRVIYEIAKAREATPSFVATGLSLDPGYLSRILTRLERDGLVTRARSDADGRKVILRLSDEGRRYFDGLEARTVERVEMLISRLVPVQRSDLAMSLQRVQALLEPEINPAPLVLRPHTTGDMGWVTERHAVLYGAEYGWGAGIEALTARICADFLQNFNPAREHCWIAERAGQRLGSVFVVDDGDDVARLRLLLVEPVARGEKLGRRLVDECLTFARARGYREMVLLTHQVLTAARAIYAATGFACVESWTHDDFGKPEVSETWRVRL